MKRVLFCLILLLIFNLHNVVLATDQDTTLNIMYDYETNNISVYGSTKPLFFDDSPVAIFVTNDTGEIILVDETKGKINGDYVDYKFLNYHLPDVENITKYEIKIYAFGDIHTKVFTQYPKTISDIYVSPNGNDDNDGTINFPFKTLKKAVETVRLISPYMANDINVYLREGTYFLDEAIELESLDSGKNGYKIRYLNYNGENVTISGGKEITNWEQTSGGLWKAKVDNIDYVRTLYVNGKWANRANSDLMTGVGRYDDTNTQYNFDGIIVSGTKYQQYKNKKDIELVWKSTSWKCYYCPVSDIIPYGENHSVLMLEQPYFSDALATSVHTPDYNKYFTIENAFELITEPGDFYYDNSDGFLYYCPYDDEIIDSTSAVIPMLEELLVLKGENLNNKIQNVEFSGIGFKYATWARTSEVGYYGIQGQVISMRDYQNQSVVPASIVPANVKITAADNIAFLNCTFEGMEAVGIGLYEGVSNCSFIGNVFNEIGHSAVSVGLPGHNYIEGDINDGTNIAFRKPTKSLSNDKSSSDYRANDGDISTVWGGFGTNGYSWWQVDLEDEYSISKVKVFSRRDEDQTTTRCNFEILASNNENFETYTVIGDCSEEFPFKGAFECPVNQNQKYRYVRIRKKDWDYFGLAEVHVYTNDVNACQMEEVCKNNIIINNYITDVGKIYTTAPAITAYFVENLDISFNEFYNIPQSGVSIGYGWSLNSDSTTCKNNRINNNIFKDVMQSNADGGAIYTLGAQPNSEIKNNFIDGAKYAPGGIYPDESTEYYTIENNVIQNVPISIFPWASSTKNLTIGLNYITNPIYNNYAANTTVKTPIFYASDKFNAAAESVVDNAGLRSEYSHIKDIVTAKEVKINYTINDFTNNLDSPTGYWLYYMLKPEMMTAKNLIYIADKNNVSGYEVERTLLNTALLYAQNVYDATDTSNEIIIYAKGRLNKAIDNFVNSGAFDANLSYSPSISDYPIYNWQKYDKYLEYKADDNYNFINIERKPREISKKLLDVAKNKPTLSSGFYVSGDWCAKSEFAVDGNLDTVWVPDYTFGKPFWWMVDLEAEYNISQIQVVLRENTTQTKTNFEIQVSNDNTFSSFVTVGQVGDDLSVIKDANTFVCNVYLDHQYRYVRLIKTNNEDFGICEVKVLSKFLVEDLTANKTAFVNSEIEGYEGGKAIDNNAFTGWTCEEQTDTEYWLTVDLGNSYKIDAVEVQPRYGVGFNADNTFYTRQNFDIIGSLDADYKTGTKLSCVNTKFSYNIDYTDRYFDVSPFKYITLKRNVNNLYYYIPEVSVYSILPEILWVRADKDKIMLQFTGDVDETTIKPDTLRVFDENIMEYLDYTFTKYEKTYILSVPELDTTHKLMMIVTPDLKNTNGLGGIVVTHKVVSVKGNAVSDIRIFRKNNEIIATANINVSELDDKKHTLYLAAYHNNGCLKNITCKTIEYDEIQETVVTLRLNGDFDDCILKAYFWTEDLEPIINTIYE